MHASCEPWQSLQRRGSWLAPLLSATTCVNPTACQQSNAMHDVCYAGVGHDVVDILPVGASDDAVGLGDGGRWNVKSWAACPAGVAVYEPAFRVSPRSSCSVGHEENPNVGHRMRHAAL
eukprot:5173910-Prymnesium_polylepis.2